MKVIPPVALQPAMLSGLAAEPRAASDYDGTINYGSGDIAKDPATWIAYQSLVPGNLGNPPAASPLYWQQIGFHEVAWDHTATYAANAPGAPVYTAYLHRVYQSNLSGNTNQNPLTSATYWTDVGPTNAYAMFDTLRNTATVARQAVTLSGRSPLVIEGGGDLLSETSGELLIEGGPTSGFGLSVVITPAQRVNAIALLGVVADMATISVISGGIEVYNRSVSFFGRAGTIDWYGYYFNSFSYIDDAVFFDLPPYGNNVITVTFVRATGNVSVGALVIGKYVDMGKTQFAAKESAENFSTIARDTYGNATLIARQSKPVNDMVVECPKASVPLVRKLKDTLNAVPAVWCWIDDYTDAYFPSGVLLAVYKQFDIEMTYPKVAEITLEIEEV